MRTKKGRNTDPTQARMIRQEQRRTLLDVGKTRRSERVAKALLTQGVGRGGGDRGGGLGALGRIRPFHLQAISPSRRGTKEKWLPLARPQGYYGFVQIKPECTKTHYFKRPKCRAEN